MSYCEVVTVLSLYFSQKECGTANMANGEVCMGLSEKGHGSPDKAPELRFL